MYISFWSIIVVILLIGLTFLAGYAGIYACNNNNFLNKNVNKRNIIIISFIFIFWTSLFLNKNVGYALGYFLIPFLIALIHSCFRNRFNFKIIIDQKFCQFLFGILIYAIIVNTFGFVS